VSYRYNGHAGIRRCNDHIFGHAWLHSLIQSHLGDLIPSRILNIFGVDVYPHHTNPAQFEPVKDFVAIGIGPLYYSNDYVEQGEPHPDLEGDLQFLVARMGLAVQAEDRLQDNFPKTSHNVDKLLQEMEG
jgi:hypothetical protein